jgi:ubiquinone/menaquinone biosynthesis C-methylase UbiE
VNVDRIPLSGVDVVADLECGLPFRSNSIDGMLLSHVLEHIEHPLNLLEELHRIAKPGATIEIRVPHGASDDAFEDPTHVRQYFPNSFLYFSQPIYWRASYLYCGDWKCKEVILTLAQNVAVASAQEVFYATGRLRNVVREMVVTMEAVKPIRAQCRELIDQPRIVIRQPEG